MTDFRKAIAAITSLKALEAYIWKRRRSKDQPTQAEQDCWRGKWAELKRKGQSNGV